jgi:hypothetical protein
MRRLFLALALAAFTSAPAPAQTPAGQAPQNQTRDAQIAARRLEIPIRARPLAHAPPRYSIPIALGGVELDAMLDTGSVGLRVLSRALPANAYAPTQRTSSYGFGSGARLDGFIANGQVAIAGLSASTPFEFVQSVGCTRREPDCVMQRMDFAHYGIGGNGVPDQGYTAIIGIGLRSNRGDAPNPLPILGAPAWIVRLPRAGETEGILILNPSSADLEGYAFFQLPHQEAGEGWGDNMLPACLTNSANDAHVCLPALIDSGAPGVKIQSAEARPGDWPAQSRLTLSFQRQTGDIALNFVSNGGPGAHVETRAPEGEPQRLMLGTLPYFSFDVFYDSVHGVVGLKPRA